MGSQGQGGVVAWGGVCLVRKGMPDHFVYFERFSFGLGMFIINHMFKRERRLLLPRRTAHG